MGHPRTCRPDGCPIAYSLDLFGDRWTLIIVRDMFLQAKRNFGDFSGSPEAIASNVLSERLKRLEEACIVSKQVDPRNQRKINYTLTQKGLDLLPLILDMLVWGARYNPKSEAPKRLIERIERERDVVAAEILAAVEAGEPYVFRYLE